ncbi:MAG: M24 family metallopeptidase [Methylocystaceae bacterium]
MVILLGDRVARLRANFEDNGIDALVVSSPENMYYLTGFDGGEGLVLINGSEQYIITDSRYWEQVEAQAPNFTLIKESTGPIPALVAQVGTSHRIGFEANRLIYDSYQRLHQRLGERLVPVSKAVEKLRAVKDTGEIELIRQAVAAGDQVFNRILTNLKRDWNEFEVALYIEQELKIAGCRKTSFDTIVLTGSRSSLPHGRPEKNRINEMLLMDFGGFYNFYAGDMTRTLAINKVSPRFEEIYNKVLEAQLAAIARVGPGIPCSEVDAAARNYLKQAGLDEYFGHGTGHGVGLEIHEAPTVSLHSQDVLQPGMLITIEPGVYIPGWGGIRIEDVVMVTADGYEVLTRSTKELLAI